MNFLADPTDLTGKIDVPVMGAEHAPMIVAALEDNGMNVVDAPENPKDAVRLGEEEVVINTPSIYPIPANKFFYVNVPNKYYGGEIVITDVVGKTSYKTPILTEQKTKVTTSNLSAGIYFVSIDFNGERVFSQRIVVDN